MFSRIASWFGMVWSLAIAFSTITTSVSSCATVTWNSLVSEMPPRAIVAVNATVLSASAARFTTAVLPSMAITFVSAEAHVMPQPFVPFAGSVKLWSARMPSRLSCKAALSACTIRSNASGVQIWPTSNAWPYTLKLSIHILLNSPLSPQLALPIWKMLCSPRISDSGTSLAATDICWPFT